MRDRVLGATIHLLRGSTASLLTFDIEIFLNDLPLGFEQRSVVASVCVCAADDEAEDIVVADKTADERRSARSSVVLAAVLEADGRHLGVRISNVSAHGALVTGDALPAEGSHLILRCNGQTITGWVAWSRPPYSGIQFEEEIQLRELLPNVSGRSHMIVKDERKVDCRRPGFRGDQLTDEERRAIEEWRRG